MNLLHATWFWVLIIAGPIATVAGILARLARFEPPPQIPGRLAVPPADGADKAPSPFLYSPEKDQK